MFPVSIVKPARKKKITLLLEVRLMLEKPKILRLRDLFTLMVTASLFGFTAAIRPYFTEYVVPGPTLLGLIIIFIYIFFVLWYGYYFISLLVRICNGIRNTHKWWYFRDYLRRNW